MFNAESPLVSVVTVNYNGAELTGDLLASLSLQTYRNHEVLVVDNASTDGSLEWLRPRFPLARYLRQETNAGFVGGNNAGIRAARGELVALANNDTVADPRWLEEMVRTAMDDPAIAAVGSKILFLRPYLAIHLIPEFGRPQLALVVGEDSSLAGCDYRKPVFREGFGGMQRQAGRPVRPVHGPATLFLPVGQESGPQSLDLMAGTSERCRLGVEVGSRHLASLDVEGGLRSYSLDLPAALVREESFDLINNAGTSLSSAGDAADRGIYEPDRGQFDEEEDLEAICGAAVLVRRSALEEVGLFDRDFFMYYEDTDLSWRLRRRGYRLRYQPASVIRHVHAASSVEWSPLFTYYTARNKILMVAKNGGLVPLLRCFDREAWVIIGLLVRACRGLRSSASSRARAELVTRLRVYRSLAVQIPRALLKRRGLLAH